MTIDQFRDALMSHLTEDLDTDRDEGGPHAQRAKMLLDHIGAIADPAPLAMDSQLLAVFRAQQYATRLAEAYAADVAR